MYKNVRITVLRKVFNDDLVDKYWNDDSITICDAFEEGQQFVIEGWPTKPERFCDWAWNDLQKMVMIASFGGKMGGSVPKNAWVGSCTDGWRPVHFLIEPLDA
jgi:uncharacterized repeat protein (TIGR04076 family)